MILVDTIDVVRPSVIQIAIRNPQTNDSQTIGSGFIIDTNGHVATAAHVVEQASHASQQGLLVSIGLAYPNQDGEDSGITVMNCFHHVVASVSAIDNDLDVAVLRMQPNPFETPPRPMIQIGDKPETLPQFEACTTSAKRPRDGEPIASSGYPLNSTTLVTTAGNLSSAWETKIPNVSDGWRVRDSYNVYLADISVNPGNSGGPVYRVEDGAVIGVCTAYRIAPLFYADAKGGQVTLGERPVAINAGLCVVAPIRHVLALQKTIHSSEAKNGAT